MGSARGEIWGATHYCTTPSFRQTLSELGTARAVRTGRFGFFTSGLLWAEAAGGREQTRPLQDGEKFPGTLCPRLWLQLSVCMDSKGASTGCGGEFTMASAVTAGTAMTLQDQYGRGQSGQPSSLGAFLQCPGCKNCATPTPWKLSSLGKKLTSHSPAIGLQACPRSW
jgi:hypothetical protein